jgi:hypothetical protein
MLHSIYSILNGNFVILLVSQEENKQMQEENKLLANLTLYQSFQIMPKKCLQGTRKDILQDIQHWVSNYDAPNILWLSGSPGAGKSAIASSVISDLCEEVLSVTFFFKSGDAYWGNPASFWASIAFQLANLDPAFQKAIVPALREGKASASKADVDLHFRHLIEAPLHRDPTKSLIKPMVVIVDALDEAGTAAQRTVLLNTLSKWAHFSPTFKLFITSRNEDDIVSSLQSVGHHHVKLYTGDQAKLDAQTLVDMQLFFQKGFHELAKKLPRLEFGWPGSSLMNELISKAAGLFIWAVTVVRLLNADAEPSELLDDILSGSNDETTLDDLYIKVIHHAFGTKPSSRTVQSFQKIVGAIIVTKVPLNRLSLQKLLCIPEKNNSVDFILNHLSSVILVGESDPIKFCHQSFVDFLTDGKWNGQWFFINQDWHNGQLFQYCLQVMNAELRFNICGLKTSSHFNNQIANLAECIKSSISSQLKYSSSFWAEHLRESLTLQSNSSLLIVLQQFLFNNLLSWLEVLSFIQEVPIAAGALNSLSRKLQVNYNMHIVKF